MRGRLRLSAIGGTASITVLARGTCAAAALLTGTSEVFADSNSSTPGGIETVTVTAERREESAQNVPISIIAIDQRDLTSRGVRTAEDLISVAPGLSLQAADGNRGDLVFSIRGEGRVFGQSADGVVTYFADVPDFANQLYDLNSVQVLKGPQGTLFGRNTLGGAVLLVPRVPTEDPEGYLMARVGDYGRHDFEFGAGGGLIGDKLMVRVSGQYLADDGYTKNLYNGKDLDNQNRLSLRGSIVANPFSWLENSTIVQYSTLDENGSGLVLANINSTPSITSTINPSLAAFFPGTIVLLPQVQADLAAQQARGPRSVSLDGKEGNSFRSIGVINTTTADLGDSYVLKNIFSYRRYRTGAALDWDGTPLPIAQTINPDFWTDEITEELQFQGHWAVLHGLDDTSGLYYESVTAPDYTLFDFTSFQPYPSGSPPTTLAPGLFLPQGPLHVLSLHDFTKSFSRAAYTQFTLKATEALALTFGIRETWDDRSGGSQTAIKIPGYGFPNDLLLEPATSGHVSGSATTWNVSALYSVTDDLNLYATVRRGYKSGGVNPTTVGTGSQFLPEFVTDYEIGTKYQGHLGSWDLVASIDGFYDDYKNIQRSIVTSLIPVATITENAAAGTTKGVDVGVVVAPMTALSLSANYTYLDTSYSKYFDPVLGDLTHSLYPNAPVHQFSATAKYTLPIDESYGTVSALASFYYQSSQAFYQTNRLNGVPANDLGVPGAVAPGYSLLNLRVDWQHIFGGKFGAALFVNNVSDTAYIQGDINLQGYGPSFVNANVYGPPRMFGVEIRYDY
jgi:iron complex outermembrane receptor protein